MDQNDLKNAMQSPQIDLGAAPWHGCEQGNFMFDHSTMFKRISPLVSPTGNEEFAAAEILVCRKCGKIPPFFAEKMGGCPAEHVSECKK